MDAHSCEDVWGGMPEIGSELEVNIDAEVFGGSNSEWDWGSLYSEPHDLAQECLACSEGSEILDLGLESETGESEFSSGTLDEPESDWEEGVDTNLSTCNTPVTPKERENKNERERMRIRKKKKALQEVRELAMSSDLIDGESKKKRWTEEYTLKQALCLINFLKAEIVRHDGRPSQVPLLLARKTVNRGVKKPPNRFLRFSQAMRPSFMMVLKAYLYPCRSKAEFAHVQVNNREVTKFLSAVWRSLSPEEKRHDWGHISKKEKQEFVELARGMIHTYSSIAS